MIQSGLQQQQQQQSVLKATGLTLEQHQMLQHKMIKNQN
jgi:hypothetical protein